MLNSILANELTILEHTGSMSLNFLEQFIGILIGAVGIAGLGIILYCLILKVVVLPLDIWQKASMRKQNLKMESMRTQLEKLKVQYANNPELYQRKIQEVYKENNFNMFSSCLPMIATLVILIFAFQSLTGYSQYMNLQTYNGMNQAYNQAVMSYYQPENTEIEEIKPEDSNYLTFIAKYDSEYAANFDPTSQNYYVVNACENYDTTDAFIFKLVSSSDSNNVKYVIDVEKAKTTFSLDVATTDEDCVKYVKNLGREASAKYFKDHVVGFGWIQNIFYPDVVWAHPIQDYNTFKNTITNDIKLDNGKTVKIGSFISSTVYNELSANLSKEKNSPNGYFVLVVLTILANLGSQFIVMRSQKAQRELQSTDQNSQKMQKWMMLIMPLLFCYFAFIYSGAFSLYLITSAIFSTISTLVVNKVIDMRFKKKQASEVKVQNGRVALTRNWEENKKKEVKKETKNKNKKK